MKTLIFILGILGLLLFTVSILIMFICGLYEMDLAIFKDVFKLCFLIGFVSILTAGILIIIEDLKNL